MKNTVIGIALACATATVSALPPVPAPPQAEPIAITGATVHVGNGEVIDSGTVAFTDGKITAVGTVNEVDTSGHRVIDASGQHLYPGFILPDSDVGLIEVGSLPDTIDNAEQGDMNPSVRTLVAYNTDSEMTPTIRYNGVLVAQATPVSGLVSGTSSIVQLDAWNWEDAALVADDGLFVNWPARKIGQFDFSTFTFKYEDNPNYDDQMQRLKSLFRDAKGYAQVENPEDRNLNLEAVRRVFDGTSRLYVRTNVAKDMILAVQFAESEGIPHLVIIGESELLEAADYLTEHDIPVIVSGVHRLPDNAYDDIDLPYRLPKLLSDKGLKVGLTYPSLMNARNLGFMAGTAAAHGLGREQALNMITLANAEILGIDDRLGSIEVGKDATLFVSSGDALDMRGNDLTRAFIGGREITLPGTQQELYRRFHEKYARE